MSGVAIVVLSWNGREDTLACLDSLAAVTARPRVILVDNGSGDGTVEAVQAAHPGVTLIRSEANLGFAEGNNLGIRRALDDGADHLMLLNNDTTVDPGFLEPLIEEADRAPDAGAVSPLILYADPPDLIWYSGASYDPRKAHNGRHWGYRERDDGSLRRTYETGRVTGCALLASRAVWERVGLLDGDLFLQVEDTEWCVRARRAGYRFYVVPRSRIWHKVSAASGAEESPTIAYYAARNSLEVGRRHAGFGRVAAARHEAGTLATHIVHARRADSPFTNVRSVLAGWRDYRRGRLGPRAG